MSKRPDGIKDYSGPAGGWGALKAVAGALKAQQIIKRGGETLLKSNQPDGFDCPSCAWPDPKHTSSFEFCENGAKAVAWESTAKKIGADFFAAHSVSDLWQRSDHWIEDQGRVTEPLRYDAATDHYVPIGWDEAFAEIGAGLNAIADPDQAEFYTSGRCSNEAAFLYQLFVRLYGTNNFPDCSNMCHEATSVGLPLSIGIGKGTVSLEDFDDTDFILSIGHNPGTNHPRMMATLREASRRGVPIIVLNPLKERSLERFESPQSVVEMATFSATPIASTYLQVKVGGDAAALKGICKALIANDSAEAPTLDHRFIAEHTAGFDALVADIAASHWAAIEHASGLSRADLERVAELYAKSTAAICCYGMGVTQHRTGTSNVQQIANLLLLRGNMGKAGAGICPLRGHSNVQGDRTVGISERPPAALLDRLQAVFGFDPPRAHGHSVVESIAAMRDGTAKAIVCLGGNLAIASSDPQACAEGFRNLDLAVHITTKLNRTHLLTARANYILPCLGRTERDEQASGVQSVTVEDSMSMVHASRGFLVPPSEHVRSEPWIVAGIAKATLGARGGIDWDAYAADYDLIRDKIEAVFPDFADYNRRIRRPGGFHLPNSAAQRIWRTESGKANFLVVPGFEEDAMTADPDVLRLTTLRAHDQYNTTVYSLDDRYRGVFGRRDVLLMNARDMERLGYAEGDLVDVATALEHERADRVIHGLTLVRYDLPAGCCASYYPETQPLIALEDHDPQSFTPSYKSVPVRLRVNTSATAADREVTRAGVVGRVPARAMRRRRDRFKQRQAALLKYLTQDGLFPADPVARKALATLDPYELRARALHEALTLPEIGRALFHLNQRRGFQSNRKTDRNDGDAGKVETGINRLHDAIEESGAQTFGEFLHLRRLSADDQNTIPSVRTRLRAETGEGAKGDGYDFYPGRDLLKAEFDEIWDEQAPHHPETLTDEVHDRLFEIVFGQRPLKAPRIGMCTLVPGEERLPKAHPLFQQRRLLEEVNALMIVRPGEAAQRLTPEHRDALLRKLKDSAKVSFETLRKQIKGLDPAARFNKESEHRKDLKGDEVRAAMGAKSRFHTRWLHLSVEAQWDVIVRLEALETEAQVKAFRAWLIETHALTAEQAKTVSNTHPPQGYGRFGLTATTGLIAALTEARTPEGRLANAGPIAPGLVVIYSEAVQVAGLGHHSDHRTGEIFEDANGLLKLPYYGIALERHLMPGTGDPADTDEKRVGRLTNPTVHIGLNQLKAVVNRLIRAYGPPAQIAVELARDLKLSEDEKKRRNQENSQNRVAAEKRSTKLMEVQRADTGANRARLKLWEELNPGNVLDRRCVYSGQQISIEMLFAPGIVEIDHILPFDATLDDSNGNKILCLREANRLKRKRSPFEARLDFEAKFGPTAAWEEIAERASRLPRPKRWRFEPDAMQRFADQGGFLARHLVDTQYLGRLAREYLTALYPDKGEESSHVWVSPGRLTEMVRRKLGLNDLLPDHNVGGGADQPKNRLDHRHHAIDAAVVAVLDRGMLNRIAHDAGQGATDEALRIHIPEPWEGFRADLKRTVDAITVAHRPDHGTVAKTGLKPGEDQTAGRLHNDTAYGFTGETDAKGNTIVVRRVPIGALKKADDIARIRDVPLRAALAAFTAGYGGNDFLARVNDFSKKGPLDYRGIRRVRITEALAVIPIRDATGRAYKAYKGDSNYRYDVWEMPDGKWVSQWRDRDGVACSGVVSMFDAHQPGERPRPHPAARKVLSLQQDDLVAVEEYPGVRRLLRVVKFGQDGRLYLAEPQESGALKARDADKGDPFSYVSLFPAKQKAWRTRQIRVDELGRVMDPGFPARKPKSPPPPALAAE